jgi:hypothetical protein
MILALGLAAIRFAGILLNLDELTLSHGIERRALSRLSHPCSEGLALGLVCDHESNHPLCLA